MGGVSQILWDELSVVSNEMIEAASRELTRISITREPDPRRPGRMMTVPSNVTEGERLAAVWRAMLAAKLGGGT